MNRRGFLKSIGKVIAGCAVVPSVAKAKQIQPHPFSPLKSAADFDALMKRVHARQEQLNFIMQDATRSDEVYEAIIKALLEKVDFPKGYISQ